MIKQLGFIVDEGYHLRYILSEVGPDLKFGQSIHDAHGAEKAQYALALLMIQAKIEGRGGNDLGDKGFTIISGRTNTPAATLYTTIQNARTKRCIWLTELYKAIPQLCSELTKEHFRISRSVYDKNIYNVGLRNTAPSFLILKLPNKIIANLDNEEKQIDRNFIQESQSHEVKKNDALKTLEEKLIEQCNDKKFWKDNRLKTESTKSQTATATEHKLNVNLDKFDLKITLREDGAPLHGSSVTARENEFHEFKNGICWDTVFYNEGAEKTGPLHFIYLVDKRLPPPIGSLPLDDLKYGSELEGHIDKKYDESGGSVMPKRRRKQSMGVFFGSSMPRPKSGKYYFRVLVHNNDKDLYEGEFTVVID